MFQKRATPPEKQLLNLIEQAKAGKDIPQAAPVRFFSIAALKGRISFFKKKINQSSTAKKEPLELKGINRLLRFGIAILAIYFITNFIVAARNLKKMPNLALNTVASGQMPVLKAPSLLKKLSYYLQKAKERDIFNPVPDVMASNSSGKSNLKRSSKMTEAKENLKLVGIGIPSSGEPDAMIEDSKSKKVYFVKQGQEIQELKVQAIFKDRVVLTYKEEELVLK